MCVVYMWGAIQLYTVLCMCVCMHVCSCVCVCVCVCVVTNHAKTLDRFHSIDLLQKLLKTNKNDHSNLLARTFDYNTS